MVKEWSGHVSDKRKQEEKEIVMERGSNKARQSELIKACMLGTQERLRPLQSVQDCDVLK